MRKSLSRTDKEIEEIYARHADTVYRLCYSYMKNKRDTEDAVQDTFLKLIACGKHMEGAGHEKAWLIVTASNICKNMLKRWHRKTVSMDDCVAANSDAVQTDETLELILSLPDRYKLAIYLYYYEGYSTKDIAAMLHRPPATIRNHLSEARKILKDLLEEDHHEEFEVDRCLELRDASQ